MRRSAQIYNIQLRWQQVLSNNRALLLPVLYPRAQVVFTPQHLTDVPPSNQRKSLMRFTLPTRFIATLTVVAIAVTAVSAAPAHADDRRVARTAAAILGLAVVGALIHDANKDRSDKYVEPQPRRHVQPRPRVEPRPLPRRVNRKILPQQCLRSYPTRHGNTHMFGRRCLEQNYHASNRLPQNCAVRIRTDRGARTGYDARCLSRSGYSLGRG